jgi:hypothetical protein
MENKYKLAIGANLVAYMALLGISLASIFIIDDSLWETSVTMSSNGNSTVYTVYGQCFLQTDYSNGTSTCYYAYMLSSFTLLTAFCISIITCFLSALTTAYTNLSFAVVILSWWIIGASVLTSYINEANNDSVPQEYYRNVILALSWTQVPVSLLLVISGYGYVKVIKKRIEQYGYNQQSGYIITPVTVTQPVAPVYGYPTAAYGYSQYPYPPYPYPQPPSQQYATTQMTPVQPAQSDQIVQPTQQPQTTQVTQSVVT